MNNVLQKPVPIFNLPDTTTIELAELNEPFVDIALFSDGKIKVDMQYAKDQLNGAINTAYVRKEVAQMLTDALQLLPDGFSFLILDAWRPYNVQLNLYNNYRNQIIKNSPKDISTEELKRKVSEFVSFPQKESPLSYVHSSGGAIDITILDRNGVPLDMGSDFDEFTPRSYTAWFENNDNNEQVKNNRRLLYNALCSSGFTNYPAEWWHYDYGDAFWSFYTQNKAKYASKFDLSEVTTDE